MVGRIAARLALVGSEYFLEVKLTDGIEYEPAQMPFGQSV
jgi:hypothetical protein